MEPKQLEHMAAQLAAPFGTEDVRWKPQIVSGSRALAVPYLTSRAIMDRLDEVFGVTGWRTDFKPLDNGAVMCMLECWCGDRWVAKTDVGGQSQQPDEGDRVKAAFSDALKRAAVQWGIGRYLYRAQKVWCGYDPRNKQFTEQPKLPGSTAKPKVTDNSAIAITEPQARELASLLKECGASWQEFAEKYQIERITALPAMHLGEARAWCDKQRSKQPT